jgi:hypothetical protein
MRPNGCSSGELGDPARGSSLVDGALYLEDDLAAVARPAGEAFFQQVEGSLALGSGLTEVVLVVAASDAGQESSRYRGQDPEGYH